MFSQWKKPVVKGMILIVFLLLAACSSTSNKGGSSGNATGTSSTSSSTGTSVSTTPQLITPKASSGSPGKGPLVISSPTMVPGGASGSQQIVLGDRTLIINHVTEQKGAGANTTLINLDLAIQNTSDKAITNLAAFFQLIGAEGDAFGYQYNSSDNFYNPIAAHTTRSGMIVFQIPAAAAKSNLHLLYRPEVATETAIILLKVS